MAVPVIIVTWPAGGGELAVNRLEGRAMFDLPSVGSRYWSVGEPFVVREVDESTDPTTVHLEHDDAFADEVRAAMPAGHWLDGGRSSSDGRWHFTVVPESGRPFGLWFGDTLDDALGQAIAAANERASAAG
jgi:hypothetical protein